MTRELIAIWSGAIAVAMLALFGILARRQSRLAGEMSFIASRADLEKLRSMVRTQMIGVLILYPLFWTPIVLWVCGLGIAGLWTVWDILVIIAYAGVFYLAGTRVRPATEKLRSLRVDSPSLQPEYEKILYAWRHKKLPRWEGPKVSSDEPSFVHFVRSFYNYASTLIILSEMVAVVFATDGGMASAGTAMFLVALSFPSSLLLLCLFPAPIFPDNHVANAAVGLSMFFIVGWIQWNLVFPFLWRKFRIQER